MSDYRNACLEEKGEECWICGETASVEVHHIDGDRSNNELDNLVPLCEKHHRAVHMREGQEEVQEFAEQLPEQDREMVRFTISIPSGVYNYIEEKAEQKGLSRSQVVRSLLEDSISPGVAFSESDVVELQTKVKVLEDQIEEYQRLIREALS